jgi:hypothetical protein
MNESDSLIRHDLFLSFIQCPIKEEYDIRYEVEL